MVAVNKWTVLDANYKDARGREQKVFDPHPGQLEMMEDPSRFLVCVCGRRLGKSNMCGHDPLIPEAMLTRNMAQHLLDDGKRREFWTVGPTYTDAEKSFRVFWNKAKKLGMPFDKPGSYYSLHSGDMTVSLWGGAFIYSAKSADNPDRLVGEGLSGVHIDEAAKMPEIVWTQMIMPTLSDFGGWAKFTTTPEGKNWIYNLYMDSIRPEKQNWGGHRIPSWRNPWVFTVTGRLLAAANNRDINLIPPHEFTIDAHVKRLVQIMEENPGMTSFEIIDMAKLQIDSEVAQAADNLTIPTFQQEYAADFTDFVGKVFKGFDSETHVQRLEFQPNWETVAAVDYGFSNPNVWLLIQIGPRGEINVLEELYQENLAPDEFADEIIRRGLCPPNCSFFYPDPALPGYTKVLETKFRQHGLRCRARAHTGGELNDRINLIRMVIKNRVTDNVKSEPLWTSHPVTPDLKRPQLLINIGCTKTIYEFGEYRYPEKKVDAETSTKRHDLPMKKDDHTPEAFGRMMASRYYDVASQMGGGGTRVSRANFVRTMGRVDERPMGERQWGIASETLPVRRGGMAQGR